MAFDIKRFCILVVKNPASRIAKKSAFGVILKGLNDIGSCSNDAGFYVNTSYVY